MCKTVLLGEFLERTYEVNEKKEVMKFKVADVMQEHVLNVMSEYDLSLPIKEEHESYEEYENSCLDIMHDLEAEIAGIAKQRFIGNEKVQFDTKMDELICEITWNELSELCMEKILMGKVKEYIPETKELLLLKKEDGRVVIKSYLYSDKELVIEEYDPIEQEDFLEPHSALDLLSCVDMRRYERWEEKYIEYLEELLSYLEKADQIYNSEDYSETIWKFSKSEDNFMISLI